MRCACQQPDAQSQFAVGFNATKSGQEANALAAGDDRQRLGDQWTFVAIDPDTKLIPAYRVGKRSRENAVAFMTDLSERLPI
jgi:hypothetical protein